MDKPAADSDGAGVPPEGEPLLERQRVMRKFAAFLEYNAGEGATGGAPYEHEYEEMMRALVASGGGDFDEDFAAEFRTWIRKQSRKRGKSVYELEADLVVLMGGYNDQFRRQHAGRARTSLEEAFFSEYLAAQPREDQVNALATLWSCAEKHDRRSQQLRGAIAQLEKSMSREGVARVLQATLDAYRAGEPLKLKDRVTVCAHQHLPDKTRIRTMGAALKQNRSAASNHADAAAQLVSKAQKHCSEPLPEGMAPVQLCETYPLASDIIRYLSGRGVIRLVTVEEHWKVEDWPEEARANIGAVMDELIAACDPNYPKLEEACRRFEATQVLGEQGGRPGAHSELDSSDLPAPGK